MRERKANKEGIKPKDRTERREVEGAAGSGYRKEGNRVGRYVGTEEETGK